MDFRQLIYITKIAECQNITKAAQELYVTQPSLSHFVAKTEKELGVKLFDRNTAPLSLTYAGERYVETANRILRLQENLKREFEDIKESERGKLLVGISQGRGAFMLPLILKEYRKTFPKIELRTFEAKTDILKEQAQKGQVDMIIMPEEPMHADLASEILYEEELFLVAKRGYIREKGGDVSADHHISLDDMGKLPMILLRRGHGIRNMCDALFLNARTNPKIAFETTSNTMALRLAAIGEGAAIVPQRSVITAKQVEDLDVCHIGQEKVTWNIVAVYRKDSYISRIEREFIETTKKIFTQM